MCALCVGIPLCVFCVAEHSRSVNKRPSTGGRGDRGDQVRKFRKSFAKVAVLLCERKKGKLRLSVTKVLPAPTRRQAAAAAAARPLPPWVSDAGAVPSVASPSCWAACVCRLRETHVRRAWKKKALLGKWTVGLSRVSVGVTRKPTYRD